MNSSTGNRTVFDFDEFDEGYLAYVQGLKDTSCPYEKHTARYNVWQLGYTEAWLDDK